MNYDFDSIAGYAQEKAELMRLCEVLSDRKRYEELGAKMPKGIIFYGPAGTGKTLFAKVMASECGLETINIDLSDSNGGDICKSIRKAFAKAAKSKNPMMIFFDELDKVLPNAYEDYCTDRAKSILTQLLTLIDGMNSSNNFIFVATCNNYATLPNTLVRPGRIDKKMAIPYPTYVSRVEILNRYAERAACTFELTMEEIAKMCTGFSCAALETLINECVLRTNGNGVASKSLISERIYEIKSEDIPRKQSTMSDRVCACRNLGFFVVARTLNNGSYMLNLNGDNTGNDLFNRIVYEYSDDEYAPDEDDDDEDSVEHKVDELDNIYFTRADLTNSICVLLGGYVAERAVFNKTYDNVSFIFANIYSILVNLSEQGMLGIDYLYFADRHKHIPYPDEHLDKINAKFNEIITSCYDKAQRIISRNTELIKKLMPILIEKKYIDRKECETILQSLGGIAMDDNDIFNRIAV